MVTTVLLKLAFTWATPDVMFLRSRRRGRAAAALPMTLQSEWLRSDRFLLAGDGLGGPLARARIGMSPLSAHRQAFAVPQSAVAAEVHQALDVHRDLTAQIAL